MEHKTYTHAISFT